MANLAANNPPSPPHTQPWLIPLPMPLLHQLSFSCMHTSCMAQISPFFPRLCLDFFKRPSLFPQGFTPPPGGFASTTSYAAHCFAQPGCGFYGAVGGSYFVGPYGCLYVPPIQLQVKVPARLQSGTSTERRDRHNRNSRSQPRMMEPESRGTGVFHLPNMNQGPRYKKRRRRRCGKRNEINGRVEERGEGSTGTSGEAQADQADYDVLLPSEWPY